MDVSSVANAASVAGQWGESTLITVIGGPGISAQSNVYFTARTERAEKERQQRIGYAVMTVAAIAVAALLVWLAKRKN